MKTHFSASFTGKVSFSTDLPWAVTALDGQCLLELTNLTPKEQLQGLLPEKCL